MDTPELGPNRANKSTPRAHRKEGYNWEGTQKYFTPSECAGSYAKATTAVKEEIPDSRVPTFNSARLQQGRPARGPRARTRNVGQGHLSELPAKIPRRALHHRPESNFLGAVSLRRRRREISSRDWRMNITISGSTRTPTNYQTEIWWPRRESNTRPFV